MRLQIVSDLHLECQIINPCAEVLALVGDIGQPNNGNLQIKFTYF